MNSKIKIAGKKNKYQMTQNEVMYDQFFRLIFQITIPALTLFLLPAVDHLFSTEITPRVLSSTIFLIAIGISFWVVGIFATRRITRVLHYYAMTTIAIFLNVIPTFVITILAAPILMGLIGWVISTILAIVFIIIYVEYYFAVIAKINGMEEIFQKSGLIDIENGYWNVRIETQIEDETPKKKQSLIALLIKIIALLISMILGREILFLVLVCLWILFAPYYLVRLIAKPAAITAKVINWEQQVRQKFMIMSE